MFKKLFWKRSNDELDSTAIRTKFIRNRIKMVEKYIPELEKAVHDYSEKMAKSRDCIDRVSVVLHDYSKDENVTTAFQLRIRDFADVLVDVGTQRDEQVRVMEAKVLEELSDFDLLCSHVQSQLKMFLMANKKEKSCSRRLKKVKASEPQDHLQISLAEEEFLKARGESTRSSKNLEEQIDIFEKKRLCAVKEAFLSWTLSELHFHAKALELFTDAYRIAADVDVNADVEEFRTKLRLTDDTPRSDFSFVPFRRKTRPAESGILQPSSAQSSPRPSDLTNSFTGD